MFSEQVGDISSGQVVQLSRGGYKVGESLIAEGQGRVVPAWGRWAGSLWVELRPRQWVKNLLVLAPLLFSQNLFVPLAVAKASAAFVLFCLISSSVYLLNDIQDCEQDRLHPQKRYRPLAAGELGMGVVLGMMVGLLLCALAGGVVLSKTFALILFGYWFINLLYSAWLKHQVILDVFAIAAGFVLRVVGGAVAIHVEMSDWLLICATLLALFLGFSKRRHELVLLGEEAAGHRQVLGEYNPRFLWAVTAGVILYWE